MKFENIEDHITEFVLGLISAVFCLMLLVLTIWMIVGCFLNVKDTMATIKIKEKIAENGIEITTKNGEEYSIEELLNNE